VTSDAQGPAKVARIMEREAFYMPTADLAFPPPPPSPPAPLPHINTSRIANPPMIKGFGLVMGSPTLDAALLDAVCRREVLLYIKLPGVLGEGRGQEGHPPVTINYKTTQTSSFGDRWTVEHFPIYTDSLTKRELEELPLGRHPEDVAIDRILDDVERCNDQQ
jgi:hypothetical protein